MGGHRGEGNIDPLARLETADQHELARIPEVCRRAVGSAAARPFATTQSAGASGAARARDAYPHHHAGLADIQTSDPVEHHIHPDHPSSVVTL